MKTKTFTEEEFTYQLALAGILGAVKFWDVVRNSPGATDNLANLQEQAHGMLRAMITFIGRDEFLAAVRKADAAEGTTTNLSGII